MLLKLARLFLNLCPVRDRRSPTSLQITVLNLGLLQKIENLEYLELLFLLFFVHFAHSLGQAFSHGGKTLLYLTNKRIGPWTILLATLNLVGRARSV